MLPSSQTASSNNNSGAADASTKEDHCTTSLRSRVTYGDSTSRHKEKHHGKSAAVKRSKGSKAESGGKWKGPLSGRQLEEDQIHQEKAYREERFMDEERMTFKDWHRRLRAAELRGNARRWKAKRAQDEQKAMEAASSFAQPIRPKPPLPLKLISL